MHALKNSVTFIYYYK